MDRLFYFLTDLSSLGAYTVVFAMLVACGMSLPLPEDIPLVASGYLIWDRTFSPIPTFLVTMIGVLLGDLMLFSLGRRLGFRYLYQGKNGKPLFKPKRVQRARAYFRKYGDKIVFFARFVVGFRGIVFFMAGAMKMKYSRFLFLDAMAALVSVPLWIVLGYLLGQYFGDEIAVMLHHLKDLKHLITLFIVILFILASARLYYKYRQNKLQKRAPCHSPATAHRKVTEKKPPTTILRSGHLRTVEVLLPGVGTDSGNRSKSN
jgi:membrane protein DedA with SNARE-associated domain